MKDKLNKLVEGHKKLSIAVAALFLIGLGSAINTAQHTTINLPVKNASASKPAPKKAKPVVTGALPNLTNTSTQNDDPTDNFVVAAKWGIEWSYDCTNDNPPGTFSIFVQNPDGSPSNVQPGEVDTNGYKGNGVQQEDLAGTYQLHVIVDPACTWSVQVVNNSGATVNNDAPKPPTTAQQVTSWYNQYGSSITALTNDFSQMSKEGSNSSEVLATCTQIYDDAIKAQESVPAIPDAPVNADWQAALKSYISAAIDCQGGVTNEDSSEISQATTEFSQGNASLTAAASAIQKLKD